MNLTPHFTLTELTHSEYAVRMGLDNTPTQAVIENLRRLAMRLEEVRAALGYPVVISSGFRSPVVNAGVGGSKNSVHQTGNAVDFICPQYGKPRMIFDRIRVMPSLGWDQLILEYPDSRNGGWVHLGYGGNRGQVLIYNGKEYKSA
jgi:uncharacterized protein YcbK (DUF882 family)